ncbi:beta strand repeat-containing protein, partial [Ferruginibacter yonginensis]
MKKQLHLSVFLKTALFILLSFITVIVTNGQALQVNTYTGSGTWVCPLGVTSVTVETWGGGGAGGGVTASNTRGGGGGGGAYNTATIAVTAGNSYNYIVGAGAVATTGAGTAGGNSSFNGTVIANGGGGGGTGAAGAAGAGGTGGVYNGGNGAAGNILGTSGGGGGGAGSTGAGGNASGTVAGAAGGTDGGVGGTGLSASNVGNAGATLGGGGSGARNGGTASGRVGGNGANGRVRISYMLPCVTPTNQPSALNFTNINFNDLTVNFTAATSNPTNYLIIRTATATAPSNPINGTSYTAGTTALGGYIESVSASVSIVSTGLAPGTTYWYWIYSFNSTTCTGGPLYRTASPLSGSATTLVCGAVTNTATMPQTGSINWSALTWSLGHVPLPCENATVTFTGTTNANETVTLNIPADISVKNLTFINNSTFVGRSKVFKVVGAVGINVLVDGNLQLTANGVETRDSTTLAVVGTMTINGNATIGNMADNSYSVIGTTGTTPNQTYIIKGNLTFNPKSYTIEEHGVFIMDGTGAQTITNNTNNIPYTDAVLFDILKIGNGVNTPTVTFTGTNQRAYMNDKGGNVEITAGSTLVLPANYSLNAEDIVTAGVFNSTFILGSNATLLVGGSTNGTTGSNFPANFPTYTISPTSTVHYNGSNAITQTIFGGVNYGNLIASNSSGSGRAAKNTTSIVNVLTSFNIQALADVTLGAGVVSTGPLNVVSTGGLYCNAHVVSGAGAFTLNNLSYLGMGHVDGITGGTSAIGNIQMLGGRSYSTSGNYIYNGVATQVTGNGLPVTINDLTINNPTIVTIAANQTVNGVTHLQQGVFDIGGTLFTSNGSGTITSTTGKMKANVGLLEMKGNTGVAQNLSGNWFVNKNISTLINANTKGITIASAPSDTLLISSALVYGTGITNSTITTNDNLTLLSRDTATANFGQIATGSGNTITGKVNVERYLYAKKAWRLLATPVSIATSPTITASWREGGPTTSTGYGTQISGPASFVGMDQVTQRASMKYYDAASNSYIDVTNANTAKIANKEGYYVFVRGDRSINTAGATGATNLRIKGDLLTGTQSFTVPANKFYSFGNPYASRIDFRTVSKSNIANAFIVWNPNNAGAYNAGAFETYTWNGTNYVKAGGVIRNFIESGEAIFVQSNTGTAGTVIVNESDKGSGSSLQSRMATTATAPQEEASTETGRPGVTFPTLEINLYAKDVDGSEYLADGVLLNFANNFSAGVDNMDVRKILNTADNLAIKNGTYNLVVERRPHLTVNDTIPLMVSGLRVAPYRFNIEPSVLQYPGLRAVLKDNFTGVDKTLSLTSVTDVSFDVTSNPQS